MSDEELSPAERRRAVRERYGSIADEGGCCDSGGGDAERLGYSPEDASIDAAELSLGCGNPTAIAALEEGETVLDLGSGGGFDCFLAAREVGESGRVVGVDMTPEMVEKARVTAARTDVTNVEFRLGEIEHLPVADASVDVVLSNCVINLSPDKPRVFAEARRVLRPGGRLAVSDVVRTAPFPEDLENDPDSLAGCVSGAATIDALKAMLGDAGFEDVRIRPEDDSREFIREWSDERALEDYIASATIEARAPV